MDFIVTVCDSAAAEAYRHWRAFTETISGVAHADAPGFVAAQIIGTVAGAGFAGWLFRGAAPATRDERHAPKEASSRLLESAD